MSNKIKLLLGGCIGFLIARIVSHPTSRIHQKLPPKKIGKVHFLPHVKLHTRDKVVHLHHWLNFSILYSFLFLLRRRIKSQFIHGFFLGNILQGLIYKDRFRIVKKVNDLERELKLLK